VGDKKGVSHSLQHANPPKRKAGPGIDTVAGACDCTEECSDDDDVCGTEAGIEAGKTGSGSRAQAGDGKTGGRDTAAIAEVRDVQSCRASAMNCAACPHVK